MTRVMDTFRRTVREKDSELIYKVTSGGLCSFAVVMMFFITLGILKLQSSITFLMRIVHTCYFP